MTCVIRGLKKVAQSLASFDELLIEYHFRSPDVLVQMLTAAEFSVAVEEKPDMGFVVGFVHATRRREPGSATSRAG